MSTRALVVLSGGQDSTTCLFIAKRDHDQVHAVTFDYGQRHSVEVTAAVKVAHMAGVASHEVIRVPDILKSASPLVDRTADVAHYDSVAEMAAQTPGGVEPTFIPARNILFLVLAANRAIALGKPFPKLYIGVSQEDYGGYPDCRDVFIDSVAESISLGLFGREGQFDIEAPLMYLSKAATCLLAAELPGCLEALAYSHTCYDGQYPPNPRNHASILRARGFRDAGMPDPLIQRAKREGLLEANYPDSGFVVQ